MKLNTIAANQTEIVRADRTVFYSYNTPVAALVPGRGVLVTSTKYSQTTSRHVKAWANAQAEAARNATGVIIAVTAVPQSEIDALAA